MEQQPLNREEERYQENESTAVGPGAHNPEKSSEQLVPRIYVASLSDYNAGKLYGVWLDAAQDPEALHEAITGMLQASPTWGAEEWAIHDFEGFNGLHLGEWEDLAHVSRVAKGIVDNGVAFAHWATLVASDEELERFEEAYQGHWPSVTDYALDLLEDLGIDRQLEETVPETLQAYVKVDAEGFGRDLVLGGDISTAEGEGGVYVFRNM